MLVFISRKPLIWQFSSVFDFVLSLSLVSAKHILIIVFDYSVDFFLAGNDELHEGRREIMSGDRGAGAKMACEAAQLQERTTPYNCA